MHVLYLAICATKVCCPHENRWGGTGNILGGEQVTARQTPSGLFRFKALMLPVYFEAKSLPRCSTREGLFSGGGGRTIYKVSLCTGELLGH